MNIGSEKINPSEAGSSRSQSHSQVSRSESLWSRVRAPAPVSSYFCLPLYLSLFLAYLCTAGEALRRKHKR